MFVVEDSAVRMPSLLSASASIDLGLLSLPEASVNAATTEGASSLPAMRGPITIQMADDRRPRQQSARRVAPALMPSLRDQLESWLSQGVVEMVEGILPGDYVSPLVAVPKPDKSMRWCVDLRCVNQAVKRPGGQLPNTDDLLAQLGNAEYFTKLDLKSGYSQLEITPECHHAFVVASPLGYFRFCRLPFGVSSGPELFQRKMEQILAGIDGVVIYLDDILVFAPTQEEHDRRLKMVREALPRYCVILNEKKCAWNVTDLTFLGHEVSAAGVRPSRAKVAALQDTQDPTNVSELARSWASLHFFRSLCPTCRRLWHHSLISFAMNGTGLASVPKQPQLFAAICKLSQSSPCLTRLGPLVSK